LTARRRFRSLAGRSESNAINLTYGVGIVWPGGNPAIHLSTPRRETCLVGGATFASQLPLARAPRAVFSTAPPRCSRLTIDPTRSRIAARKIASPHRSLWPRSPGPQSHRCLAARPRRQLTPMFLSPPPSPAKGPTHSAPLVLSNSRPKDADRLSAHPLARSVGLLGLGPLRSEVVGGRGVSAARLDRQSGPRETGGSSCFRLCQ
jgi:hypothetical protein